VNLRFSIVGCANMPCPAFRALPKEGSPRARQDSGHGLFAARLVDQLIARSTTLTAQFAGAELIERGYRNAVRVNARRMFDSGNQPRYRRAAPGVARIHWIGYSLDSSFGVCSDLEKKFWQSFSFEGS
jgi:hypothetical protein